MRSTRPGPFRQPTISQPGEPNDPHGLNMQPVTIAAIATPPGSGGIGIIRISGPASPNILAAIFRRPGGIEARERNDVFPAFTSHRLYLGHIIDPVTDTVVDEVLTVVMRAPRSYTAEDVVEIQSHSGYVVLNKILRLVLAYGARLAEPGEFTRRAFMNNRIDLTQAEAVVDLINARTGKSLDIAASLLAGRVGRRISEIRENLLSVIAEIEAEIDFGDDMEASRGGIRWAQALTVGVVAPLEELIASYEHNHYFRDGIRMAIIGRPNVGKSSLLNRLTRKERAIVTEIPGTTRDTIEEMVSINGLPVIVVDTAGLHDATQPIEKMGIERTHAAIRAADIVLLVVDISQGVTREDRDIFKHIRKTKHIVVMNKVDLHQDMVVPRGWEDIAAVKVSALEGTNMDALKEAIFTKGVGRPESYQASTLVPNLRQTEGLKKALQLVGRALKEIGRGMEIAAMDLGDAKGEMDRILGLSPGDDVLDQIFSQFCIGK
jgi:tRNA modification GTPase